VSIAGRRRPVGLTEGSPLTEGSRSLGRADASGDRAEGSTWTVLFPFVLFTVTVVAAIVTIALT
jgi:hypothetical protein